MGQLVGQLGIILIVGGIVVYTGAWVKRRRGWQVIGALIFLGGQALVVTSCLNADFLL